MECERQAYVGIPFCRLARRRSVIVVEPRINLHAFVGPFSGTPAVYASSRYSQPLGTFVAMAPEYLRERIPLRLNPRTRASSSRFSLPSRARNRLGQRRSSARSGRCRCPRADNVQGRRLLQGDVLVRTIGCPPFLGASAVRPSVDGCAAVASILWMNVSHEARAEAADQCTAGDRCLPCI
jgi:hypothetical protein